VIDVRDSLGMQELLKHYNENKLSHAFLIETNNQEKCLENLLDFLAYINQVDDDLENSKLANLIKNKTIPSLSIIYPDGQSIKKEQIIELKSLFKTKPTFSTYNMYVIMNAEMLNVQSANTMLKFLEEPEDNILGFFITNNKENIINTIKSRCQIVLDYYSDSTFFTIPKVWQNIALNYVKEINVSHDDAVLYNKNVIIPLVHDKRELLYLFQSIFQIYDTLFQVKLGKINLSEELVGLSFLLEKEVDFFLKELKYLSSLLDEMNYNLNIQLIVDRYVLESR